MLTTQKHQKKLNKLMAKLTPLGRMIAESMMRSEKDFMYRPVYIPMPPLLIGEEPGWRLRVTSKKIGMEYDLIGGPYDVHKVKDGEGNTYKYTVTGIPQNGSLEVWGKGKTETPDGNGSKKGVGCVSLDSKAE